jgi:hypothetical protein
MTDLLALVVMVIFFALLVDRLVVWLMKKLHI